MVVLMVMAETPKERRERFESEALPLMNMLFAGAMKLARNQKDAEDLVQDTFVRSFEKFHLFKPGTNFKAWMFRVMTNRFINLYRRKKSRGENTSYNDVSDLFGDEDKLSVQEFQTAEKISGLMKDEVFLESLDERLKAALEEVGDDYREVLIMSAIGEMPYKEIAKVLEIPVGTVMSRLSRAKSLLRDRISDLGAEELPSVTALQN